MTNSFGGQRVVGLLLAVVLGSALLPALGGPPPNSREGDLIARLRQRLATGVLRWGGDAEGGAPFQLRDPQQPDRIIGYEVELADALAEVLAERLSIPLRAQFVQYEWVTLPAGLTESKDFDCFISGKEIPSEAASEEVKLLYSRPYYAFKQQLVVRKDDQRIESLDDCLDKTVGTMDGTAAKNVLDASGVRDVVAYDGQVEPYLDLEIGRLDAVLLDAPIALYYASTKPNLRFAGPPFGDGRYGIALRPDDQDLAKVLDDALGELMSNGRLRQILRKWHLWNPGQAALAMGPRRMDELRGLGFDELGQPLVPDEPPPVDAVDVNIIAASAKLWTFDQYAPLLLKGAGMTVFLSTCSMALAIALGLIVALCRLYGPAPVRWLALGYVEFFRGIPLLLLLFFLYYGLASYGLGFKSATYTAILGFGINYAAFEAEIYRSAILAVPVGQWEAARALGMTDAATFRRIIFPQALRTALPPMTNDFVAMFKDTSLVSVIAVHELTKEYLILSRSSMKFLELGLLTAALYLIMSVPLGYLSRYLERRWAVGS